jgi:hypothetical protein
MFLAILAAAAAFHSVDTATALSQPLHEASAKSGLALHVPPTIPYSFKHIHGEVTASKGSYDIELSPVKHCGGANACTVGRFAGDTSSKPFGSKTVHLHKGITGKFKPLSCGGSCSPATISWRQDGATYLLSLNDLPQSDRKGLKKLANAAIDAFGF